MTYTDLEILQLKRINDALHYNMQTLEAAKNGEKDLYFRGEKANGAIRRSP